MAKIYFLVLLLIHEQVFARVVVDIVLEHLKSLCIGARWDGFWRNEKGSDVYLDWSRIQVLVGVLNEPANALGMVGQLDLGHVEGSESLSQDLAQHALNLLVCRAMGELLLLESEYTLIHLPEAQFCSSHELMAAMVSMAVQLSEGHCRLHVLP